MLYFCFLSKAKSCLEIGASASKNGVRRSGNHWFPSPHPGDQIVVGCSFDCAQAMGALLTT